MAYVCDKNEVTIWNYFKSKGLNEFGCAGLIGNLQAESALNPKNLQSTGNKKLGMTDDEYVKAVDNGSYTKEQFVKDQFGMGLAQWTYHTRKNTLYEYAKSSGKSIGDLGMQLDFLYKELSENYKSVLNSLKNATSVLQASNAVLLKYERPKDQSVNAQNKRASYGQAYYDKYANSNTVQNSTQEAEQVGINVNELLSIFEKMYREHWSYIWGSAKEGCVDCSGAFVYAYKKLKGPYIYHGSNSIARKYVGALKPISAAKPGWAAFKWKKDGAPSTYTDGKGNFYHIGLVDSTGKYVLNAKGTKSGFCRDSIDSWHYVAPLKAVNYNNEIIDENTEISVLYQAIVNTVSGSLNLRNYANGNVIGTIPKGAVVDVLSDSDDWFKVRYNNKIGYSMKKYLTCKESSDSKKEEATDNIENTSHLVIGDKVKLVSGATYTSGKTIPSWVFDKILYVRKLSGNIAIISTLKTGAITGIVYTKHLKKIGDTDKFSPYDVKVTANTLRIRSGAGTNCDIVGTIKNKGTYTIIEEMNGIGATKWLRLENGRGWIASDYTVRV